MASYIAKRFPSIIWRQQKTRVFECGPIFRQIPWVQNKTKTSLFVRNLQINQHQVKMSKRKAPSDENPNADFVDFLFELANYEKNVNRNVFKHNAYRLLFVKCSHSHSSIN